MPCYHPIPAVRLENGEVSMLARHAPLGEPLQLPCGSCIGCRTDRVRSWSVRAYHESLCWDFSWFLTLTYDDKHLPSFSQLSPRHLQLFIKKVRRAFTGDKVSPTGNYPIRFLACGEYGGNTGRPHYHILLYNVRLHDLVRYDATQFQSAVLSRLWGRGTVTVGTCTPASCSYVAGYALKKIGKSRPGDVPDIVDPRTGEVFIPVSEFARMSNRPGLGKFWLQRYAKDLQNGYVVHSGSKLPIPRYYRDHFKSLFPAESEELAGKSYLSRVEKLHTDPTFDYRNSSQGREAAEFIHKARKRTLTKPKVL